MLIIVSRNRIFCTKDVGEAIRRARAARRLTQVQLAEHANVSRGVLQKLEEGRGTVALDNLLKLLHILSLDLEVHSRTDHERGMRTHAG